MLRVDPSFQVLASSIVKLNFNKELSQLNFKKDNPELRQTRVVKQVIIVKHKHNSLINIIPLSSLSYLRDDSHKQAVFISESHSDLNRCTPCRGKFDQHATHFPGSIHVWSPTIYLVWTA
jgi:hypothetical protein